MLILTEQWRQFNKTLRCTGLFFQVDRYRTLHYNKGMSTQKHTTKTAEKRSWKKMQQNGLTGISTAAIIVA
jgi:hypothetical protein